MIIYKSIDNYFLNMFNFFCLAQLLPGEDLHHRISKKD
jgi:hypothetical protein